jgi:CheY-like chemotaxis protein
VPYVEASDLVEESHTLAIEKLHCTVRQVFSEAAAMNARSSEEDFDLIILGDVSKPVKDEKPEPELSIIRKARQDNPRVPIIIFTSDNYIQLARDPGATDFLLKPAGVIALSRRSGPTYSVSY